MHLKENLEKGILFVLLTFFVVAIMSAMGKAVAPFASPVTVLLFQNGISLLLIIPLILKKGIKETFATQRLPMHFFRAFTGTACWYCLFVAIKIINLSTSVLLIYSAPLWMPILGHLFFKEKVHPKVWLGVTVGFIGIALVLQIHSFAVFENYGVLIGLAGGVFLALAMFAVRWLNSTEHSTTILTYYFFLATLMVLPLAYFNFHMTYVPIAWIYLVSIGITLVLSQFLIVKAFQHASAVKLSPFIYSVIVFTAIIDAVVWHEIPGIIQIIGMLLVIVGGIFAMRANAPKKPA